MCTPQFQFRTLTVFQTSGWFLTWHAKGEDLEGEQREERRKVKLEVCV